MTRQDQTADGGALAVQSGRDTIIQQGVSVEDMKAIIAQLRDELFLPSYVQLARATVDERMLDFEARVLERFIKDDKTRRDAFADPDFQAAVITAQRAHARSGDEEVRDILIDLIAHRSAQPKKTRLSLSLNQAVEKAAALTHDEFTALTLCYFLKYCRMAVNSYVSLVELLQAYVVPFVKDMPETGSVIDYLEAQGCGSRSLMTAALPQILLERYPGVLSKGFTRAEWDGRFDQAARDTADSAGTILVPCLHDQTRLQLAAINKSVFEGIAAKAGLHSVMQDMWAFFEGTRWADVTLVEHLSKAIPEMRKLFLIWQSSGLSQAQLTPVGIALAHTNLQRVCPSFTADLSIWIK